MDGRESTADVGSASATQARVTGLDFGTDYTNGVCDGLGLGDANDDCLVTGLDLISVQQNFGHPLVAPIPEPAAIAALVIVGGRLMRRKCA